MKAPYSNSADVVRKHLYKMYYWHTAIKIADAGNIQQGATLDVIPARHCLPYYRRYMQQVR